jgi:hypothetical protein
MSINPFQFQTAVTINRSLGSFVADCVVEENHDDEVVMTDNPLETGSVVTDHIYKMPSTVTLTYVWAMASEQNTGLTPTFLQTMYSSLLAAQAAATLVNIVTGKRNYVNMAIQSINCMTDKNTENILMLRITCRYINFVSPATTSLLPQQSDMQIPEQTQSVSNTGTIALQPAPTYNFNAPGAA